MADMFSLIVDVDGPTTNKVLQIAAEYEMLSYLRDLKVIAVSEFRIEFVNYNGRPRQCNISVEGERYA